MDMRWLGFDPEGRARIGAALLASCGRIAPPPELERLAKWADLSQAVSWGLAIRLCRRLGAGSHASLRASTLTKDRDRLILSIDRGRAQLVTDPVTGDLKALAQWLGLEPEVRLADRSEMAEA
jgi:exopolyphosphatase/guanosine-5'-triphosphate,3'-diphosphate pyrophosphatase